MKAAVVHSYDRPLSIEDVPIPEPGPEQVLVRIEASGLCHTDIHAARGEWPVKPPLPFIPGHEGVGIVEEVGFGSRHEVFELHRRGATRVLRAERPLDDVNETFAQVLDGSAPAPRMVFDLRSTTEEMRSHVGAAVHA